MTSYDMMVVNEELNEKQNGAILVYLTVLYRHLLEGTEKTTRNSQDDRAPGRDSNRDLSKTKQER